jgi:hypothetical protein
MSEEWVPNSVPSVPPDSKFREDLHRALEETHRQQMAQRKLGARPEHGASPTNSRAFWLLLIGLLTTVGLVGYLVSRSRR